MRTTRIGKDGANQIDPVRTAYADALDRALATDTQSFDGTTIHVSKTYNAQLQVASTNRPYFPASQSPALTTFTYDPLNRVTATAYPDGSSDTIQYSQTNKSVTTGILGSYAGQNIWKGYDQNGNIISSIQGVTKGGTFTNIFTTYLYDGFNNLMRVTDTAGNVTQYSYDAIGRKTNITDPDAGGRNQGYNAFGDLIWTLDGRGTWAWMTYDALNRMTLRCWTNGTQSTAEQQTCPSAVNSSSTEVRETWSYDPSNGIGEMGGETTTDGYGYAVAHSYNGLGQPLASKITIGGPGAAYYIDSYAYTYDANNRPFGYVSPSGAEIFTQRNAYGYTAWLQDGIYGPNVWNINSRDAELHSLSVTFGNATNSLYSFDPNTGRQTGLITHGSVSTTQTLQWVTYAWDQLGNLKQRNDIWNGLEENFAYDELNRLTGITLPSAGNAVENSFTYDLLGDMLSKGDVGAYAFPAAGAAQPHGVRSIAYASGCSTAFAYDADGNVLSGAGRTLAWKLFNMPASVTYGGKAVSFQYDADHNRVLQVAPEGNTAYLPDGEVFGPGNAAAVFHTYFASDGERVAEDYGPAGALKHHYFHNDDQNSIGFVTDDSLACGNGSTCNTSPGLDQNSGFDAFGQPRNANGSADPTWGASAVTTRGYINQEKLTDLHLVDLNARVYDPAIGQFLSPDPVISDQDNSQSWNAYAYSHNNPVSKSDPTGLDGCENGDGSCEIATSMATGGFNAGLANVANGNTQLVATNGRRSAVVTPAQGLQFAAAGAHVEGGAVDELLGYAAAIQIAQGQSGNWDHGTRTAAAVPGPWLGKTATDTPSRVVPEEKPLGDGGFWVMVGMAGGGSSLYLKGLAEGVEEVGALLAPRLGTVVEGGEIAKSSLSGLKLSKQLASESQMVEAGQPIAGAGSKIILRDATRLAKQYGGDAGDWAKMSSRKFRASDGSSFETHWYQMRTPVRLSSINRLHLQYIHRRSAMPDHNGMYKSQVLEEIIEICRRLKSRTISSLEGVRRICALRLETGDPDDALFVIFRGIESETDEFPLGIARARWSAHELSEFDTQINEYIEQNRTVLDEGCDALIDAVRAGHLYIASGDDKPGV